MKTRPSFLLILIVLIVTIVAFLWRRSPTVSKIAVPVAEMAPSSRLQEPSLPAKAPHQPAKDFATYHWRTGEHASWQVGVSMQMADAPERITASGQTRLGGKLQLVVLNVSDQRVTLAAALSDAWVEREARRIQRFEDLFNGTPAILTLSPAGNLLEVAFPNDLPADDREMLGFAYGWEFVARPAASYAEVEHAADANAGAFRATYRRLGTLRIQKARQVQPTAGQPDEAIQNVVASQFSATIGKLWVDELSGWEDTVLSLNGNIIAASRVAVTFKEETNATPLLPALTSLVADPNARRAFTVTPDPIASSRTESASKAVRREALTARWGGVPFENVLGSIQTIADGSMEELAKPLKDLEDWLVVHPDEGPIKLLQSLQAIPADDAMLSGLLVNSLAEADTLQSRKALAAILDAVESFPPTTAIQAVVAVGDFGEKALPSLKESLASLMDSSLSDGSYRMADTALYSLARIAKEDTAARDYLLQRVAPWLEVNAIPNDTVKAFSALANAAVDDPLLLERASLFAKSNDAEIRLAVVDYLGSLGGSSSGRTLLDQLASDPDPQVQSESQRLQTP